MRWIGTGQVFSNPWGASGFVEGEFVRQAEMNEAAWFSESR